MSEVSGTAYSAQKGSSLTVKRGFANIASATTDGAVVAAVTGKSIRVLAAAIQPGGTATTVIFNSKPAGAGTAISATFDGGVRTPTVLPYNPHGWFQTTAGEGLSVTTGTGSAVGVHVTYIEV